MKIPFAAGGGEDYCRAARRVIIYNVGDGGKLPWGGQLPAEIYFTFETGDGMIYMYIIIIIARNLVCKRNHGPVYSASFGFILEAYRKA